MPPVIIAHRTSPLNAPENSLATRFPSIARQWHPTKNGSLRPEQLDLAAFVRLADQLAIQPAPTAD